MKNLKIAIWVFVLFIFQTVCINYVRVNGIVPDAVFAFVMALSMFEGDYVTALTVSIICGVFSGSLVGGNFALEVILYTYSTIFILKFRDKSKNFPRVLKVVIVVFILSAASSAAGYFINSLSLSANALTRVFIPYAVYNTLIAIAVYLLLKYTVYSKEDKHEKQLIS